MCGTLEQILCLNSEEIFPSCATLLFFFGPFVESFAQGRGVFSKVSATIADPELAIFAQQKQDMLQLHLEVPHSVSDIRVGCWLQFLCHGLLGMAPGLYVFRWGCHWAVEKETEKGMKVNPGPESRKSLYLTVSSETPPSSSPPFSMIWA